MDEDGKIKLLRTELYVKHASAYESILVLYNLIFQKCQKIG